MFQVDEDGMEFLAQIENWFRNGTQLDVQHQSYLATLGAGGGTPLVNGASQTGQSLITDGWPNSTLVLKAGDIITLASIDQVFTVAADGTSDGSGELTLTINPPIFAGGEPATNAAITVTASVVFKAKIISFDVPAYNANEWVQPVVVFREDV